MITKSEALILRHGQELVSSTGTKFRVNGKCQTWKTRPEEFRLPLKYGFRGRHEVNHYNAQDFSIRKV